MKILLDEIMQIPGCARECLEKNKNIKLPHGVPYLGMGASYYASLTLYYCQTHIEPYIASEYYHYFSSQKKNLGVLVSQSGESSEILWNLDKFSKIIAITNSPKSTLAQSTKIQEAILLHAGEEKFSTATKTYINTLLTLYMGLGLGCEDAVKHLEKNFQEYDAASRENAKVMHEFLSQDKRNGLYIIGSGPNIGTAMEGALALSETTKLSWIGLPLGMFDHGPKEALNNSAVIFLSTKGKDEKRQEYLEKLFRKRSNALVLSIGDHTLPELLTPITLSTQIFLFMNHLSDVIKVNKGKWLGGKVTRVEDTLK